MIVMPANNSKAVVHYLAGRYPGRIGWLIGPGGWRAPHHWLSYSLDNGRFVATTQGKEWDESAFWTLIEKATAHETQPAWVVVPDVVGDRDGTLREWDAWAPRLSGIPLAMAVQDGMTPEDVPSEASVVFIGGTTGWKRRTMWQWCQAFDRVHVGRINTERWLWECHRAGVESCDGTGWFRGDKRQLDGLFRYLEHSTNGEEIQRRMFA